MRSPRVLRNNGYMCETEILSSFARKYNQFRSQNSAVSHSFWPSWPKDDRSFWPKSCNIELGQ